MNLEEYSHGMWRRIWVITFPRELKDHEVDRQLESKLSKELSGIFNWALEGYNKLRENKFALPESDSMKLSKSEYRNTTDSVRSFIKDRLVHSDDPDARIKFSEVYSKYQEYCLSEGIKNAETKQQFRKVLEDMKFNVSNSKRDKNQVYIFNVTLGTEF